MVGIKYSLLIGAIIGSISTLVGISFGIIAGYVGGKIDVLLNSLTNAVLVIPSLPLLILLTAITRANLISMCLIISIFTWPWAARTIRAQVMSLKEMGYVDLAKVTGLKSYEIMFFEILPNIVPYIGTLFAGSVIGGLMAETGVRMLARRCPAGGDV